MLFVILLAIAGGLFAILTFIHFFVDWIFQSHAEAMVKHNNAKVRAKHCAIYTLGFVPLLLIFLVVGALTLNEVLLSVLILFVSHFVEDTYLPVFFWAKHIRRPPQMQWTLYAINGMGKLYHPDASIFNTAVGDIASPSLWRLDIANSISTQTTVTLNEAQRKLDMGGFKEFVDTSIGKILMITIDQIIHLVFLFPIVWMVVDHLYQLLIIVKTTGMI